MKNLVIIMSLLVVFTACNTEVKEENETLKSENAALKAQNDSLREVSQERKASVENYQQRLAEIDKNLAEITADQSMVSTLQTDIEEVDNKEVAEAINQRIANMRTLMENSRNKIMALDRSLSQLRKQSGAKSEEIEALEQRLEEASQNLIDKQEEITQLTTSLEERLAELGQQLEEEVSVSEELRRNLNRAYYYVGESKELQEKEIVTKEGGFIGLGRVKVINANAADTLFTRTDKTDLETIFLDAKKATLITNHPEGSYELVEEGDKIESFRITNPAEFWKDSNYIVIEVDR
ncbi:hypothetical protein JKA74_09975 [Marivirga sp. S37H4]|uniref:Chromosome segregation protein SMC n=1 Tax=Marivirga aurantiaca TaxID=2802615 RepID=A0A934WYY1_9BACT|nr:hypothetical protein [Marivirga aurantiaca]MBK6265366.1 hypothetical protein [Marivirga aurantiaca]